MKKICSLNFNFFWKVWWMFWEIFVGKFGGDMSHLSLIKINKKKINLKNKMTDS